MLIDNYAFDANPAGNGMAADLHAARLRLDATEADRAALESELASVQGRLHDALEVLEGALGERSALMRHNRDLQAQLGAALQRSPALGARADGADASAAVPPTPERRLRQELALAQVGGRLLQAEWSMAGAFAPTLLSHRDPLPPTARRPSCASCAQPSRPGRRSAPRCCWRWRMSASACSRAWQRRSRRPAAPRCACLQVWVGCMAGLRAWGATPRLHQEQRVDPFACSSVLPAARRRHRGRARKPLVLAGRGAAALGAAA